MTLIVSVEMTLIQNENKVILSQFYGVYSNSVFYQ